jgi:hypothetical protein
MNNKTVSRLSNCWTANHETSALTIKLYAAAESSFPGNYNASIIQFQRSGKTVEETQKAGKKYSIPLSILVSILTHLGVSLFGENNFQSANRTGLHREFISSHHDIIIISPFFRKNAQYRVPLLAQQFAQEWLK